MADPPIAFPFSLAAFKATPVERDAPRRAPSAPLAAAARSPYERRAPSGLSSASTHSGATTRSANGNADNGNADNGNADNGHSEDDGDGGGDEATSSKIQAIDTRFVQQLASAQVLLDMKACVKELVENALDAGATRIDLTFVDYGLTAITVADNGKGVPPASYAHLGKRHHTSKLRRFEDLAGVTTLGFRGEALHALCSIADVTLTTCTAEQRPLGRELVFKRGGIDPLALDAPSLPASDGVPLQMVSITPVARDVGVTVTARGLFSTLPVRRAEFRRHVRREYAKCLELIYAYGVLRYDCRFTCTLVTYPGHRGSSNSSHERIPRGLSGGGGGVVAAPAGREKRTTVLATRGGALSQLHVLAQIYGRKVTDTLLAFHAYGRLVEGPNGLVSDVEDVPGPPGVAAPSEPPHPPEAWPPAPPEQASSGVSDGGSDRLASVTGFISKPTPSACGRGSPFAALVYLNGRPIDFPRLSQRLNALYRTFNPARPYPFLVAQLALPAGVWDINVTPDKRHVIFQAEAKLVAWIETVVARVLDEAGGRVAERVGGTQSQLGMGVRSQTWLLQQAAATDDTLIANGGVDQANDNGNDNDNPDGSDNDARMAAPELLATPRDATLPPSRSPTPSSATAADVAAAPLDDASPRMAPVAWPPRRPRRHPRASDDDDDAGLGGETEDSPTAATDDLQMTEMEDQPLVKRFRATVVDAIDQPTNAIQIDAARWRYDPAAAAATGARASDAPPPPPPLSTTTTSRSTEEEPSFTLEDASAVAPESSPAHPLLDADGPVVASPVRLDAGRSPPSAMASSEPGRTESASLSATEPAASPVSRPPAPVTIVVAHHDGALVSPESRSHSAPVVPAASAPWPAPHACHDASAACSHTYGDSHAPTPLRRTATTASAVAPGASQPARRPSHPSIQPYLLPRCTWHASAIEAAWMRNHAARMSRWSWARSTTDHGGETAAATLSRLLATADAADPAVAMLVRPLTTASTALYQCDVAHASVDSTVKPDPDATPTPPLPSAPSVKPDSDADSAENEAAPRPSPGPGASSAVSATARRRSQRRAVKDYRALQQSLADASTEQAEAQLVHHLSQTAFASMHVLGQFNLGFILARHGDHLYIIDQHASDEKHQFEKLRHGTAPDRQVLIQPIRMQLTAEQECLVMAHQPTFNRNGFDVRIDHDAPPGHRTALYSVPQSRAVSLDGSDFEDLLHQIGEHGDYHGIVCKRLLAIYASRACRKAIMIGTPLSQATMVRVVRQLAELRQPWSCPHGRPTVRHLLQIEQPASRASLA